MDDIKTNKRLFDLVRYQRSELLEAGLITDDEYLYILADAPLAQGAGSPSPRRLEDYDQVKASYMEALELFERSKNTAVNKWVARLKVAEDALKEIAAQKLADEMDDHTAEGADYEGGYEAIVRIARTALNSGNSPITGATASGASKSSNRPAP